MDVSIEDIDYMVIAKDIDVVVAASSCRQVILPNTLLLHNLLRPLPVPCTMLEEHLSYSLLDSTLSNLWNMHWTRPGNQD